MRPNNQILIYRVTELHKQHPDWGRKRIAEALGVKELGALRGILEKIKAGLPACRKNNCYDKSEEVSEFSENTGMVSTINPNVRTLDDLLRYMKVDLKVWEVERYTINKWETVMREPATTVHVPEADPNFRHQWKRDSKKPLHEPLYQVKAWLKRRSNQAIGTELLLDQIKKSAPKFSAKNIVTLRKLPHRRSLEIELVDEHLGLLCAYPEADAPWSLELASAVIWTAIEDLLEKVKPFGPFEEVFFAMGNDSVHSDTVFHTTTAGTGQPESISWHKVYAEAEKLAIAKVDRLRLVANDLYCYEIPGNHSRQADFTLARIVRAYFHADPHVHVDASSSPYKFHRFGGNLIGFEHGHSVNAIRLAGIMANERPDDWAATASGYREWHLGDQHRKGSSKPSCHEEQGVAIEYIPSLVAPNEWHRLKGFNHQQRGAMAWVWDHTGGPIARFQFNLNNYSLGKIKV